MSNDRPVMFRLWGAVEARANGMTVAMGTQREQCMLVGLLAAGTAPVRRVTLRKWIWDDEPDSASDDLNKFMSRLRKRLSQLGLSNALDNKNGLCRLGISPSCVDAHRVKAALAVVPGQSDAEAAERLGRALQLCDGEPLAGLSSRQIDSYRREMEADRLALRISYYRIELRLGRYQEHLGKLTTLLEQNPADRQVTTLTMYSLCMAGRQSDALEAYTRHRNHLLEEKGLDVDPELVELHGRVLRNELTTSRVHSLLGGANISSGASAMKENPSTLVAVRPDTGTPEEIHGAVTRAFGEEAFRTQLTDDCLIFMIPDDVPTARVIGTWMTKLSDAVRQRTQVGIALAGHDDVCELARSDYARQVLNGAPDSKLVVAVSNDLYRSVVLDGGGAVDPTAYRRTENGVSGWVCVPGMSVPPHPCDDERAATNRSTMMPAGGGPQVNFYGATKIRGGQTNATVINNYKR